MSLKGKCYLSGDLIRNDEAATYQAIGQSKLYTCIKHMLTYNIITDYGSDIDPVYIKNLTFYLNRDAVVAGYEVKEWHNGK